MTYKYHNCHLLRVIDGDTFVASIDVGFNFTTIQRIRLMGCDMPERNQPGGKEATAVLTEYLTEQQLFIATVKQDSFGRWLAFVQSESYSHNASQHMSIWLDDWRQKQTLSGDTP